MRGDYGTKINESESWVLRSYISEGDIDGVQYKSKFCGSRKERRLHRGGDL